MTHLSDSMPPLAAVQAALHRITEDLANSLEVRPAETPRWSELEWRLAPAVAAMHGVSALLAGTLRWQGPQHWMSFLAEQRRQTLLRQQRIDELLKRIDERARSTGIALVGLKGAALRATGLYASGERPMADIDLLVSPQDLEGAVAVLLSLSYRDAGTTWKHQGFEPPGDGHHVVLGEHPDNPIKIDLHRRIIERLPLEPIELTDIIYPAGARPGINPYPCVAAMMAHLLAHAAGNMPHRGVRLMQLSDISRLARRMSAADWQRLLSWHGPQGRFWWAGPPLRLTARYFPHSIPDTVLCELERGCPRLLKWLARRRTLAQASYSSLYIRAVPGITWTRSAAEALRYVASRARPGREQLAIRRIAAKTGPWSAEPGWHAQPQSRRILLWLFSRPTRTETLQPVRAALARSY